MALLDNQEALYPPGEMTNPNPHSPSEAIPADQVDSNVDKRLNDKQGAAISDSGQFAKFEDSLIKDLLTVLSEEDGEADSLTEDVNRLDSAEEQLNEQSSEADCFSSDVAVVNENVVSTQSNVDCDEMVVPPEGSKEVLDFGKYTREIVKETCCYCNVEFPSKAELLFHATEQEPCYFKRTNRPLDSIEFICEELDCQEVTGALEELKYHMSDHWGGQFECKECCYSSIMESRMKRHLVTHPEVSFTSIYPCEDDEISMDDFDVQSDCDSLDLLTEENPDETPIDTQPIVSIKKFNGYTETLNLQPCPYCNTVFQTLNDLKMHRSCYFIRVGVELINSGRAPTKVKKYHFKCDCCEKTFRDLTLLSNHSKLHYNKHQFQCTTCAYATFARQNMIRHRLTHTGK